VFVCRAGSCCSLTIELSGRARCLGCGMTRPTTAHGPLERVVRGHSDLVPRDVE
jgi:hypothetical protein